MNAEQNLRSFAELEERQARDFSRVAPAFDHLYDALSPQQRQIADQSFREMTVSHEHRMQRRG